jgi:hypothetical protein
MLQQDCRIHDLPRIMDTQANRTFIEENHHAPFPILQVYYLYGFPGGAERGGHAHKALHQLIIAISGSFDVVLDDVHEKQHHLDEWNGRRATLASHYLASLTGTKVTLPAMPSWAHPAWHLFMVRSAQRDGLQCFLHEQDIATLIHYPVPPHLQPAYREPGMAAGTLPITKRLHRDVLSLPIGPHLQVGQVDAIVSAALKFGKRDD